MNTASNQASAPPALGFPRLEMAPRLTQQPTPLPKRPKGRWFVGLILGGICAAAIYGIWDSFFRYAAYGTITGRTIEVSSPWAGELRYMRFREGEAVRQGEILFVMDSLELRHRHAQLSDELRVGQANLAAETARLKWQVAFNLDQGRGAITTYYEALGRYLRDQARLDDLRTQKRRAELLWHSRAIAQEELQQIQFAFEGQTDLVAKLKESLPDLKQRADQAGELLKKDGRLSVGVEENGHDQLKPLFAKIEVLEAERERLQERLDEGQVRAPTNGIIVKHLHFPGEHCKAGEPVLLLLEEGSLEAVLYLPQERSASLPVGAEVDLVLAPHPSPIRCQVFRLGAEYESAPEHLKRHYREGQRLLPAHLRPGADASRRAALRVGSVVKLTYFSSATPRE